MIYRNSPMASKLNWWTEPNAGAGEIAREFLSGERELLQFVRAENDMLLDLIVFLEATRGLSLTVRRSVGGELLVTALPWAESLLLTGRTADVLRGYIDNQMVRMADRFDMTVRQSVRSM